VKLSDEPQTVQPIKKAGASDATPVVQMHGMGDFANDPGGMVPLANAISEYLGGAYVLNVQIGDSSIADIMNGFIMNLHDQVDYFANVVASDVHLAQGFNAVGYSQVCGRQRVSIPVCCPLTSYSSRSLYFSTLCTKSHPPSLFLTCRAIL
jgi:hypothetical protein